MGGLVEEQVEKSISALIEQNSELAKEVADLIIIQTYR
jgi:phosphate uptake regulator